jgi:hypothetical protein
LKDFDHYRLRIMLAAVNATLADAYGGKLVRLSKGHFAVERGESLTQGLVALR